MSFTFAVKGRKRARASTANLMLRPTEDSKNTPKLVANTVDSLYAARLRILEWVDRLGY